MIPSLWKSSPRVITLVLVRRKRVPVFRVVIIVQSTVPWESLATTFFVVVAAPVNAFKEAVPVKPQGENATPTYVRRARLAQILQANLCAHRAVATTALGCGDAPELWLELVLSAVLGFTIGDH